MIIYMNILKSITINNKHLFIVITILTDRKHFRWKYNTKLKSKLGFTY